MKNAKEAIKYGIETLKVSPEEMFSLIESSKDYDGDDYPRWLANKIIKLAEEDGVGYSQLLVKRFNIISDLLDNDGEVFKSDFIDYISGEDTDIIYGLDEYDKGYSEDLDWFKGIDLDVNNSEFLLENFEDIYNRFLNVEEAFKMLLKPSRSSTDKSSELYADAKSNGIICKNEGMLMLYRLCMIVNAFSSGRDVEVTVLTDVDFLMDEDVQDLMSLFLSYFKVEGYFVKASDIYENTLNGTKYAVMKCVSRTTEDNLQDCIELNSASYVDGEIVESEECYRFTKSNKSLLSELNSSDNDLEYSENETYLGSLILSISRGLSLANLPKHLLPGEISITLGNLEDCIVYYGVAYALKTFGINEDIKVFITGSTKYEKLLYNCLPLFLYSPTSCFREYLIDGKYISDFNDDSEIVQALMTRGEVYFSFEAKELIDLYNKYKEELSSREELLGENISGVCTTRACLLDLVSSDKDFTELYFEKVRNLCGYIKSLYKDMV